MVTIARIVVVSVLGEGLSSCSAQCSLDVVKTSRTRAWAAFGCSVCRSPAGACLPVVNTLTVHSVVIISAA